MFSRLKGKSKLNQESVEAKKEYLATLSTIFRFFLLVRFSGAFTKITLYFNSQLQMLTVNSETVH